MVIYPQVFSKDLYFEGLIFKTELQKREENKPRIFFVIDETDFIYSANSELNKTLSGNLN